MSVSSIPHDMIVEVVMLVVAFSLGMMDYSKIWGINNKTTTTMDSPLFCPVVVDSTSQHEHCGLSTVPSQLRNQRGPIHYTRPVPVSSYLPKLCLGRSSIECRCEKARQTDVMKNESRLVESVGTKFPNTFHVVGMLLVEVGLIFRLYGDGPRNKSTKVFWNRNNASWVLI